MTLVRQGGKPALKCVAARIEKRLGFRAVDAGALG